tara:strand:+ start:2049 stop:2834 length:786 start_codon:yes stop_codon:yes gene_type:complete
MKVYWTLISIAYLGKSYHGSQIQPNVDTVGSILTEKLIECGASNPKFASRTDKGVSAISNVILTSSEISSELLAGKLTEKLSGHDVWINGFCEVKEHFNPRKANSRLYRYLFFEDADIEEFSRVMKKFEGIHNFEQFSKIDKRNNPNPEIEISHISVSKIENGLACDIKGRSFLWHQIRTMIGAASDVCRGARTVTDIRKALAGESIYFTVSRPEFLTLLEVNYEDIYFEKLRTPREVIKKHKLVLAETAFWNNLVHYSIK